MEVTAPAVDVAQPEPGAGQVLVKVGGNGICQSDLHTIDDWVASPPHLKINLPMTLGHEVAGWIEALGPGVADLEIGQPCVVTIAGCGHCRTCAQGWNNYCQNLGKQVGMGLDGGLGEYVVLLSTCIVPLGSIAPWQAAPFTDAGLSSYHAVKRVLPLLMPGTTAVVIGIGGLGHLAISALKAVCAARIVAVDQRKDALALAKELGADVGILANDGLAIPQIGEATEGSGADAVLDFVGAGSTIRLASKVIRPLGHIVVVGRSQEAFEFKDRALPYGASMSTTFGGSKLELMELLALAEAGKIQAHITRYPLSQVGMAFDKLRRGEIVGRAVVVPDGH